MAATPGRWRCIDAGVLRRFRAPGAARRLMLRRTRRCWRPSPPTPRDWPLGRDAWPATPAPMRRDAATRWSPPARRGMVVAGTGQRHAAPRTALAGALERGAGRVRASCRAQLALRWPAACTARRRRGAAQLWRAERSPWQARIELILELLADADSGTRSREATEAAPRPLALRRGSGHGQPRRRRCRAWRCCTGTPRAPRPPASRARPALHARHRDRHRHLDAEGAGLAGHAGRWTRRRVDGRLGRQR
jgi:hypothetical protein